MATEKIIKKVNIKYGTREKLSKMFGVHVVTVSLALSGTQNSKTANKIRKAAVEMGGDPIYEN